MPVVSAVLSSRRFWIVRRNAGSRPCAMYACERSTEAVTENRQCPRAPYLPLSKMGRNPFALPGVAIPYCCCCDHLIVLSHMFFCSLDGIVGALIC